MSLTYPEYFVSVAYLQGGSNFMRRMKRSFPPQAMYVGMQGNNRTATM